MAPGTLDPSAEGWNAIDGVAPAFTVSAKKIARFAGAYRIATVAGVDWGTFHGSTGRTPMVNKSVLSLGLTVALVVGAMALPARATPVGAVIAAGAVGVVVGAGLASAMGRDETRFVEPYPVWDYGVPGHQRPRPVGVYDRVAAPGPGRHRVCAWQDRYDRHERYIGSRRICWVEAR